MSLDLEDQSIHDKASEGFDAPQKSSKVSYTRDFLLTLSGLEICKELPRGFDRSVLSEFEDTSHDIQERTRIPGGLPLQGFRRGDYGSSPPAKGESSNHSRGVYGRWDNRSSGRSDKDSDSQSDLDSEPGRRYGNTSRRSWQGPDHDGLLGSGSFPRPSGLAAGIMAPKSRGDDQYQLKKSNEPYHPPRPYKAVPHSRREHNDSLNDETFGSSECTSEDRAEEERKRRASFELMRKEQQKVLQDKQKSHLDKHKDVLFSDDITLNEQAKEGKPLERSSELKESGAQPAPNNDSVYSSLPSQAPRPLVPPGFASTILEKSSGQKSHSYTHEKEVVKHELEEKILPAKAIPVQNGILNNQAEREHLNGNTHAPFEDEMILNPFSVFELPNKRLGLDDHLFSGSTRMESKATDNADSIHIPALKMSRDKVPGDSNQENSMSILEKLFGSSLTVTTSSSLREPHESKPDVTCSPDTIQASKFARWFVEDEKKPTDDLFSVGPSDLLSLIGGGEKGGVQASNVKASHHVPQEFTHHSSDLTNTLLSSISPAATGISEQLYSNNKLEPVPTVLTCEDLEQKILSEYSESSSTLQPPVQDTSVSDTETVVSKSSVDNHASQHLLSLLQKGADLKEKKPIPTLEIGSSNNFLSPPVGGIGTPLEKSGQAEKKTLENAGKNITLEALFGSSFMKELQSVEAPVSVHRSLAGSARADVFEPHNLTFPLMDAGPIPSATDEVGPNRRNYDNNVLAPNSKQQTKLDKVENWLGFEETHVGVGFPKFQSEGRHQHGFDGGVDIQLPEEDSLITVADPLNPSNSVYMPGGNSNKSEFLSSSTSIGVAEKLAALNAGFKDERSMRMQEGPQFVRGPYDMIESEREYQNLHARASPPQFHSPNMSHGRPFFHPTDAHPAHIASKMRFIAPESIKHDGWTNNQFPGHMLRPAFPHPNTATGFDIPSHHQMLQQTQMPGSFPPPNLLHEFPRGGSVPPQPSNQPNVFMQEPNSMQGFPLSQRHPNVSGLGMALPAPDVGAGSNHPEALQRLIGMELRGNPKPVQPFGVNNQGIYNHELDMGFRFR